METVQTDEVEAELRRVLGLVEDLGVRWHQTRFDEYLKTLAGRDPARRWVSLSSEAERDAARLDWEANTQVLQLVDSSKLWPRLEEAALVGKLKEVFSGSPRPPAEGKDDKSRNYLLELTSAARLAQLGFEVKLTSHQEDVRVSIPDFGWVAVECKRPAGPAGFEKNVKKLRRQLQSRLTDEVPYGFAILGIDRIVGAQTDFLAVRDRAHLKRVLDEVTRTYLSRFVHIAKRPPKRFKPRIPFAGMMFSGAVLVQNEDKVCSVSQLGTFFPGDEACNLARRVKRAFARAESVQRTSPSH